MNNQKRNLIIGLAALLLMGGFLIYKDQQPNLSKSEKERIEALIAVQDAEIQKDKSDQFAYLDKAEYLRELGKIHPALVTLEDAYKINPFWKESGNFMVLEARIRGDRDTDEGIEYYLKLFKLYPNNEDYFREYIGFLKKKNMPREMILEVYKIAIDATDSETLKREFAQYQRETE